MRRMALWLVAVVAVAGPVGGQVMPADDCSLVWTAEITELPLASTGYGIWADDVDLAVDLGSACASGAGGTPLPQGFDMVFLLTLPDEYHDVSCSFISPNMYNTTFWTFVLSTSCAQPVGGGACLWGRVVPPLSPAGFNTAGLGLAPGSYYLWLEAATLGSYWEIQCTGTLVGLVFRDGFESGSTGAWSAGAGFL